MTLWWPFKSAPTRIVWIVLFFIDLVFVETMPHVDTPEKMEKLHYRVYKILYTDITGAIKTKDVVASLFSKAVFGIRDLEKLQKACDSSSLTDAAEILMTEVVWLSPPSSLKVEIMWYCFKDS